MSGFELQQAPTGPADAPAGPISPDKSWSPLECWIWEKLQAGAIANVDEYADKNGRLPPADPKRPEVWQDGRRRLAPRFLEDLLLRKPYGGRLHRKGVRIRGAWFDDEIDLEWAEVTRQIWLEHCRFERSVLLTGLHTPHIVSFDGSAFAADLRLSLARIGAHLSAGGVSVDGAFDMNSADIGQSLLIRSDREVSKQRAAFHAVVLAGAKVGGKVDLIGAKVAGKLNMDAADIGQDLIMRSDHRVAEHQAEFNEVDLRGAKVGGQVDLTGAKVAGKLGIYAANIGESLFIRTDRRASEHGAEFDGGVDLIFAEIGRNLDVRGAILSSLDLTGTRIGGELRLASPSRSPRWQDAGRLVLRNASVDAIQDSDDEGVWPPSIDLDGFTYRRLGGLGAHADRGVAKRGSQWYLNWLARDEPYTPRPYQQCAQVLRETGHPEMANRVLYAGRERERKQAWRTGNNPRGTGLTLLKWFVGYGYGQRLLWHPVAWVVALVAAGTAVLHLTGVPMELAGSEPAVVAYSFDTLLPIVELEQSFADVSLHGFAKYYFYFQKLMGWVLASFLIAGLSGLTK